MVTACLMSDKPGFILGCGSVSTKCPTNFSLSQHHDKLKLIGHQTYPLLYFGDTEWKFLFTTRARLKWKRALPLSSFRSYSKMRRPSSGSTWPSPLRLTRTCC